MSKQPIENAQDADLRLSVAAMQRAAQRARELAVKTGTATVMSRDEYLSPTPESATPGVQQPSAPSGNER